MHLEMIFVLSCVVGICNTVIYNKKYMFDVQPVPGTELLQPLEFPGMRVTKLSSVMLMMGVP